MNNDETIIKVDNIKKSFKVYYDKGHTLKERALSLSRNKYEKRNVINGISFEVKRGEAVGLVGHNGCGKSTTLKMLTRIMYPDSGNISIKGRVSSLLELGAGFHPDMSGRENIYINASIFGLTTKEIDERIPEIIEFSELEDYIDNPVRTYSSGMYMRLAFSVAINVNADVLLIDEILGVGDVNFQAKCFNKLMEIKGTGTTIVLVSHSTAQIERICDRSIWIQDGLIKLEGSPIDVHREYLNFMAKQREEIQEEEEKAAAERNKAALHNSQNEAVEIDNVDILDSDNQSRRVFRIGDSMKLSVNLRANEKIQDYFIELNMVRADGVFCYGCSSAADGVKCEPWSGNKIINISFEDLKLLSGKYHFDLHVAAADGSTIRFVGKIIEFQVIAPESERGMMYIKHEWNME